MKNIDLGYATSGSSRIPASTYRLQFHPGFTFQDAQAIVPYLARLGVTDCYCSPYLRPRPGSAHGYDICDHNQLNPELGTESDFDTFAGTLAARGMGHILDFVPNHMGVDPLKNPWWRGVLEDGPASPYARFFDIDWNPVKPELRGKVLLPALGDHYGNVLERGELKLALEDGALVLLYFEQDRPIDPQQYPRVLGLDLDSLKADLGCDDHCLREFIGILTSLEHLPSTRETAPERIAERQREKGVARERLLMLLEMSPRIRRHVDENIRRFNGEPSDPGSFDRLHELLDALPYRLANWKTAFHEINYRRFFDIRELVGMRMENPAVFEATHQLVLRLCGEGKVTGIRIDHIDGLFDPTGYLEMLQAALLQDRSSGTVDPPDRPFFIVVEKILSGDEGLLESWPVAGTTGYEFLNDLNRLFVDPRRSNAMGRLYERFTGRRASFEDVAYECKKIITSTALASELNVLAHALNRISEGDRRARDFTLDLLREAIREVVACFPVYRTYVDGSGASESDRRTIDLALSRARRRNPAMEPSVFEFVRAALLLQADLSTTEERGLCREFAGKFQQYTGPVHAKGVEDTAFYRHNLLVSLNEVGGDPRSIGGPPARFHEANLRRRERWPFSLLATDTHDTKRGEDARARLNVLSEIPEEWGRQVFRWTRINRHCRTLLGGEPAPDRNDEYLFYQALLGAWPPEAAGDPRANEDTVRRIRDYMIKAIKEAKVHTSWIYPEKTYEEAVIRFVDESLTGPRARRFLAEFLPFERRVAHLGMVNSLAQVVLKAASPGVSDFYQGSELWDFSLVDPDNRRPVDFVLRKRLLEDLEPWLDEEDRRPEKAAAVSKLLSRWTDGRIKLYITACCLRLRRRLPQVFLEGEYVPLEIGGERGDHVIALARRLGSQVVIAIAPRLVSGIIPEAHDLPLGQATWRSTRVLLPRAIEADEITNVITGEKFHAGRRTESSDIPVAEALRIFPVALLWGSGERRGGPEGPDSRA